MKKGLKAAMKAIGVILVVFSLFLGALCFRSVPVPSALVHHLADRIFPDSIVLTVSSVRFGFRDGFFLRDIRIFDRSADDPCSAVFRADELRFDIFARRLRLKRAIYPRLPDSYYRPGNHTRNERLDVALPALGRFSVELQQPVILGLEPEIVTADVAVSEKRCDVSSIFIRWPGEAENVRLDGFTCVDFVRQCVVGEVRGLSRQAHIRPLLIALDEPVALPYMDGFTNVKDPVPAFCGWNVDLVNSDFRLKLDLHPTLGRYNAVPLAHVDGEIGLHVYTREDRLNFDTTIGPLTAVDSEGRTLDGKVVVSRTNGVTTVSFDARSTLPFPGILDVIDYLNDGTLACVTCETAPEVTVKGRLATDIVRQADNDLSGHGAFAKGTFFGIPVADAAFDYSYIGERLSFTNVTAVGKDGGRLAGSAVLSLPGLDAERATFRMNLDYKNGTLSELADAFDVDFGRRNGVVDAEAWFASTMTSNLYARLGGAGRLRVHDGHLAQIPLFMGLTDLLAEKVPGVSAIVNRSDASCDFTISNGVFRSENFLIEGGLFSLKGRGTYDIPTDELDFLVRIQFLRDDSLLGLFVQPITWPFSKLLMEFRVRGSAENPQWTYVTLLDKVL